MARRRSPTRRQGGRRQSTPRTRRLTNWRESLGQRSNDDITFADRLSIDGQTGSRLGATQLAQCRECLRIVAGVPDAQATRVKIVHRDPDSTRKTTGVFDKEHRVRPQTLRRGRGLCRGRAFGVDALAEYSEFRDVAFAGGSHRGRMTDRAPAIDEHGCAVGDSGLGKIRAVCLRDGPFGLKIGQQREGNTSQIASPIGVAMNTVDADTQNLGVCGLEARQKSLDSRHFLTSGGRPVEWVEEQQDVPPIAEVSERNLSTELVVQAEPRCGGSFADHGRLLLTGVG